MHHGQLALVVDLQPWEALAVFQDCRICEFAELATINEGFQNNLLNIGIVADDGAHISISWSRFSTSFLTPPDGLLASAVSG